MIFIAGIVGSRGDKGGGVVAGVLSGVVAGGARPFHDILQFVLGARRRCGQRRQSGRYTEPRPGQPLPAADSLMF